MIDFIKSFNYKELECAKIVSKEDKTISAFTTVTGNMVGKTTIEESYFGFVSVPFVISDLKRFLALEKSFKEETKYEITYGGNTNDATPRYIVVKSKGGKRAQLTLADHTRFKKIRVPQGVTIQSTVQLTKEVFEDYKANYRIIKDGGFFIKIENQKVFFVFSEGVQGYKDSIQFYVGNTTLEDRNIKLDREVCNFIFTQPMEESSLSFIDGGGIMIVNKYQNITSEYYIAEENI